jgi:hypothetical protein
MALSRLAPQFKWSEAAGRYRAANGRFVPRADVRAVLLEVNRKNALEAKALAQQLRDRSISIADWQRAMAVLIRNSHLAAAAAARGGWDQLTPADLGRVGQIVRVEFEFLEKRAQAIVAGTQRMDGSILDIAGQYPRGGYETYFVFNRIEKKKRGFTQAQNIQTSRESCEGCQTETDKGRVDIEGLIPPGRRAPCHHHCECYELYFNTETGEESE